MLLKLENILIDLKRREIEKKLARFSIPYKLHLGCGTVKFDGWINIDSNATFQTVDIAWDLARGIPVKDASCRFFYAEHLLEHMTVETGVSFLRECARVLMEGGILRIAMTSLDDLIEKSCHGNWRDQDWLSWPEYQFIQTRAEMLNVAFRWWGHQWLYDREELHRRLKEAGFSQLKDVQWGSSDFSDLKNRETRTDSLLICEATKVK